MRAELQRMFYIMPDGTIKQINPFSRTEVWTVPGRGNKPDTGIDLVAKVPCPLDSSMPSGHAVVSGIFLLASVATPLFPLVLPLSLLVSFSRVYLGIHTVADIAGGLAVGAAIYALCEKALAEYRRAML